MNKFLHGPQRPGFLGERLRPPTWWRYTEVITAFDKIMIDKVCYSSIMDVQYQGMMTDVDI